MLAPYGCSLMYLDKKHHEVREGEKERVRESEFYGENERVRESEKEKVKRAYS